MWTDPITGEVVPSYPMLTLNVDAHQLMSRMHKLLLDLMMKLPLPFIQQDKRSLVLLEPNDFDQWRAGQVEEANTPVQLTPVEWSCGGPVVPLASIFEAFCHVMGIYARLRYRIAMAPLPTCEEEVSALSSGCDRRVIRG